MAGKSSGNWAKLFLAALVAGTSTAGELMAAGDRVSQAVFVSDDSHSENNVIPTSASASGTLVIVSSPEPEPQAKPLPPRAPTVVARPLDQAHAVTRPLVEYTNRSPQKSNRLRPQVRSNTQQNTVLRAEHVAWASGEPTSFAAEAEPAESAPTNSRPEFKPVVPVAPAVRPASFDQPEQTEAESVSVLLLQANELSQQAITLEQFTQVYDQCLEAIRLGAEAEKKAFARQLISWALNRRGQIRLESGELEAATTDFLAALDFNPHNWRAVHNRGVTFAQGRKFADAFDDFNKVIEINPKFAKAYANRATLYVQAGDLDSALADYQRALEQDNRLISAYVGLARAYHLVGQRDLAIEQFDVAARLEPTSASILCGRADLLADMGRYGEALAGYARTIEFNPQFGHAYRNGAWLLATCPSQEFRDPENAILGAQQALELGYGDRTRRSIPWQPPWPVRGNTKKRPSRPNRPSNSPPKK
jgi:tetratricopeptide (TPR) repeat protein